jgi:hypothetical protein
MLLTLISAFWLNLKKLFIFIEEWTLFYILDICQANGCFLFCSGSVNSDTLLE